MGVGLTIAAGVGAGLLKSVERRPTYRKGTP